MHYGAYSTDSLMAITNRPDLVFERGEGSWLTDHQGRRYLDFIQGWRSIVSAIARRKLPRR